MKVFVIDSEGGGVHGQPDGFVIVPFLGYGGYLAGSVFGDLDGLWFSDGYGCGAFVVQEHVVEGEGEEECGQAYFDCGQACCSLVFYFFL